MSCFLQSHWLCLYRLLFLLLLFHLLIKLNLSAVYAVLVPHKQKSGTNKGSSYVDDFESSQTGIDLRSP